MSRRFVILTVIALFSTLISFLSLAGEPKKNEGTPINPKTGLGNEVGQAFTTGFESIPESEKIFMELLMNNKLNHKNDKEKLTLREDHRKEARLLAGDLADPDQHLTKLRSMQCLFRGTEKTPSGKLRTDAYIEVTEDGPVSLTWTGGLSEKGFPTAKLIAIVEVTTKDDKLVNFLLCEREYEYHEIEKSWEKTGSSVKRIR